MAYYKVNGVIALTDIFASKTSTGYVFTYYNQSGVDIYNLFLQTFSCFPTQINDAFSHVSNTNYKLNGIDIKTLFLPVYVEFTGGSGTVNIPSWCKYVKALMIGGGGGGGGGDNGFFGNDFDAGSSGGGGAFVDTQAITIGSIKTLSYTVGGGGTGGGGGNQYNWVGGDGTNGGDSSITYNCTSYTAGGGGKRYGGNGYNGTYFGASGIAYGSSTINKNGNPGLLGGTVLVNTNSSNTGLISGGSNLSYADYAANALYFGRNQFKFRR